MILAIDVASELPVYEQIVRQVTDGIRSGELAEGTRLPTVRQLADDLGVAVNTVAKAYRQLETAGHVATRGRNGTVVRKAGNAPDEELIAAATLLARLAQRRGVELAGAVALLREAW